ncbi:MAG: PAS-domain containing protein, partial [Alphaproteobacteria bacterium]|nr:PAS-domain containing protein [Alphaproteobacteria bacterium]
ACSIRVAKGIHTLMNIEKNQLLNPNIAHLINLINFGISVFDAQYNLIVCNDCFLNILGYPREFAQPGTPLKSFHQFNAERGEYGPKDFAQKIVEDRIQMMTSGKPYSVERVRPNGQTILVNSTPLEDGGFIATYMDISNTKRIISELQEQSKELSEIMRVSVECLPHGISVFDRDLNLKICNSTFLHLLDFPLEFGQPGTPFENMVRYNIARGEYGDGDPEQITASILERAQQFEPHKFVRQRPDGRYLEVAGQPMEYGFVTTYRDVTAEQQALVDLTKNKKDLSAQVEAGLADLHATNRLLNNVLDTIPIRVFWKDTNCKYQGGNKNYLKDRDLDSPKDLIDKTDYDFFSKNQAQIFIDQDKKVMESGKAELNFEETFVDDQNNEKWIKTNKIPLFDSQNVVVGILGTYEDISAQKMAELEIRKLNEELENTVEERTAELKKANHKLGNALQSVQATQHELIESEKMASLGGLVSGIAHEVNTPIGVSVTAATLFGERLKALKQKFDTGQLKKSDFETFFEEAEQNCGLVYNNLNRAAKLIGSFKKVAVDQSHEDIRRIGLREYMDEIILNLTPKLKRTKLTLTVDIDPTLEIETDPGSLAQVITNLIMNSIIHGFPDNQEGNLSINAELDGNLIHLLFSDDGQGMSQSTVSKIFEPFFTTRRGQGGSGLGMNIVYNLVTQKMKGRIKCISTEGEGAQFLMCLPTTLSKVTEPAQEH